MTEEHNQGWYAAFKAKDARFDGRFFVGVSSTGIYCRPVCRAKLPKIENCTYYANAAEAEAAGYRPCLLCRPEQAPGASVTDASAVLAHRAARLLEESCGNGQSLEELAVRLGCTDRHLRRVFMAEYRVSPVQYLQTCRLLLAKNLLTDTNLTVLEVAMAAGFGSLRRFNDLFKTRYRLSPTDLRRRMVKTAGLPDRMEVMAEHSTGSGKSPELTAGESAVIGTKRPARIAEEARGNSHITLNLGYRPPYQWQQILDFLALRAIPGVELVKDGEYQRTVRLRTAEHKTIYGWVRVGHRPEKHSLVVTADAALVPVLPQVLARVRHLFDLYCDPEAVYETLAPMNEIRPGLCVPGTRVPGCFDAFEMAVRAVLGQQITVKAAGTLAARMVTAYGTPVSTGIEGLNRVFPSPEDIMKLEGPIENHLGPLGITAIRARVILKLAEALVRGEIDFGLCAQPEQEMEKLMELPGIGAWTAQYIAMRAMEWPDSFLETDVGVKKALAPRKPKELREMAEAWRPWRSYATVNLWNTL